MKGVEMQTQAKRIGNRMAGHALGSAHQMVSELRQELERSRLEATHNYHRTGKARQEMEVFENTMATILKPAGNGWHKRTSKTKCGKPRGPT